MPEQHTQKEMALSKFVSLLKQIKGLPVAAICLDHSVEGNRLFRHFTKRHPRFPVFRYKTIGVALIDRKPFSNGEEYVKSVNGKNSAAYFMRKSVRAGYSFRHIDPIASTDAIYAVNISAEVRQGRVMDESYRNKFTDYPVNQNNSYYGVFLNEQLVAYLWVVRSGELAVLNRLLGHADHLNNGVMYHLVTGFVEQEFSSGSSVKYVMYDTFFGATEGLKMFKQRCGFKPWRVKWKQS